APPPPYTSQVTFATTAGVTYSLMVSSFSSPPGPGPTVGTLNFHATFYTAPPNDNFSGATVISTGSVPFTANGVNYAATTEGTDPFASCGSNAAPLNTLWYRFTPPADTTISVDTIGSGYDTILSAYTG